SFFFGPWGYAVLGVISSLSMLVRFLWGLPKDFPMFFAALAFIFLWIAAYQREAEKAILELQARVAALEAKGVGR
ncbi:MAG TPA: hypothetical protein VIA62_17990, partial [Thermoanaerobaculia bacterium]|nr:hypothetical protein [Thermoanaerobaculia bacterium]